MDLTLAAVRVGLDLNELKMQVASANIAAADVPGARLKRVDFSEVIAALQDAAQDPGTSPARLETLTPGSLRGGIQTIGTAGAGSAALDDQIAELNSDSVTYRALAVGLTRRFALMQLAIAGK